MAPSPAAARIGGIASMKVATKTGFGKAIGKFVVVGAAAFGSAVAAVSRNVFRRA